MHGLLLLANGFEDTEALTTRDVLIRSGIKITIASISANNIVMSSFGVCVLADTLLKDIKDTSTFDFLILPGGGRGTQNLKESLDVKKILLDFYNNNKLICAICAAPSILGMYGLLKEKKYTCFAGFNKGFEGNFTGNEVEVDGNIITARSMQYSINFALAIIKKLLGEEIQNKVATSLRGECEK